MAATRRAFSDDEADSPGSALRAIAARLLSLADGVEAVSDEDLAALSPALHERDQIVLRIWAEAEYNARRKRREFLPEELLGEPAWDMLLDLFIQNARRKRTSVSSACLASGVPETTALRWLGTLEDKGLIERLPATHDRRVHFVELTQAGALAVSRWLRYRAALPVY